MRDLVELIDAVDLAVGRAGGIVDAQVLSDAVTTAGTLRSRRGFFGESLVFVLAGGTGSGKSSLVNAIAGAPIASVSHLRPHTDEPLAWIPRRAEEGLRLFIEEFGVSSIVEQDLLPGVALVDLPDMDSIAAWHRRTVEEILPRADGIVWLFDPDKYRDRVVHEEFLRPLARHRDQFLFVLNKVDRLSDSDLTALTEDMHGALAEDGFPDAKLFLTAADPDDGSARGIETLVAHLRDELDAKRLATVRLIADADTLLRTLARAVGVWAGTGVDFGDRWERVRRHVALELGHAHGAPVREDALCYIEDLVASVSVDVGEVFGVKVRQRLTRDRIESAVDAAVAAVGDVGPERSRWRLGASRDNGARDDAAASVLDERIGRPMRDLLWDRARLGATIAYAAVGARELRHRIGVAGRSAG